MKSPNLVRADDLKDRLPTYRIAENDWVLHRQDPHNKYSSFLNRAYLAYGVFVGKFDALYWEGNQ